EARLLGPALVRPLPGPARREVCVDHLPPAGAAQAGHGGADVGLLGEEGGLLALADPLPVAAGPVVGDERHVPAYRDADRPAAAWLHELQPGAVVVPDVEPVVDPVVGV